ncbi:precorrin-3B synthase [Phormidesmis priestleyi]
MSEFTACPGLFYATSAADGVLSRLRIPGGILNFEQCEAIADLADQFGGGYVDVTNRANLQIRESKISSEALTQLQEIGLASPVAEVDAIRNIMSSPTAGIDRQAAIDVRPFVTKWNQIIIAHPEFAILSAKFSVCFDGGEAVSVRDRPNDIAFSAVENQFRLALSLGERGASPLDVGVSIGSDHVLPTLLALTEVYCDLTRLIDSRRKPRLRDVLHAFGVESYLQKVEQRLPFEFQKCEVKSERPLAGISKRLPLLYQHLGIQAQRQTGLFYVGIVLPLARLETFQLKGLANLSKQFGSGELRLTPWQNVLIDGVSERSLSQIQRGVEALGLDWSEKNFGGAIVACSGKAGCASSATETKQDAIALVDYLKEKITLDRPVNLHFSGCKKSCAQHTQSDITLLGVETADNISAYDIYISDNAEENTQFGQIIHPKVPPTSLPPLIENMLKTYQLKREDSESFREFTQRYSLSQLQHLFNQQPEAQQ